MSLLMLKKTIKLYVLWTKIIVAQKAVTLHFRGLYFFLKISITTTLIGPYFSKTSTHAHLKYWISLRSQPFQGFLWLNIDFASSQGSLIHLGEFSRRGWGGLSFHRVNDITAPFLCWRSAWGISLRGGCIVKVLDFRKLLTSRREV